MSISIDPPRQGGQTRLIQTGSALTRLPLLGAWLEVPGALDSGRAGDLAVLRTLVRDAAASLGDGRAATTLPGDRRVALADARTARGLHSASTTAWQWCTVA